MAYPWHPGPSLLPHSGNSLDLSCVRPQPSSIPPILVEHIHRQLPGNDYREVKHLRPCISDRAIISPSHLISSVSEYRILGWKSLLSRFFKASLHYFLTSGIAIEKFKAIQSHSLWNGMFSSPLSGSLSGCIFVVCSKISWHCDFWVYFIYIAMWIPLI